MLFHEDNPVPSNDLNKRLKMQFREQTSTSKRDAPKEVTFLDIDNPTPAEEHIRMQPPQNVNRIPTRQMEEAKLVEVQREEEEDKEAGDLPVANQA